METIGYAALQVIPSLKGVQATMDSELGAMMPKAGQKAGRSFSDGFARQAKAAVQITADVTATAMTAAAATGTAALVKGWDRLTTIQDASGALSVSLGDSAAAASLLGDTLDVVRGTPFNLDQFAAGAQQMAGMGVEAAKVPHYLEAIGEASATQGKRADEFANRLIGVFSQISSAGQLDLGAVWQISETGVNALAILANSYGVTRDEMKSMISDGAVPAAEALDAISDGILNGSDGAAGATLALAGTMEELRNGMSGAVGGISPALARLGAAVLAPFSPAIITGANSLVDIIDDLGEEAGDLAEQVAGSPGFDTFMRFLEDAPDMAKDVATDLAPVLPIVTGLASALGAMGSGSIPILGRFLPTINPVLAGMVGLAIAVPEVRDELTDLGRDLAPVVREFADRLMPVLGDLTDVAGDVLPPAIGLTGDALLIVLNAAMPLVGVVGDLTSFLADHEGVVVGVAAAYAGWKIAEKLTGAGDAFDNFAIKAFDAVGNSALVNNLELISSGAKDVATNILTVPEATDRMAPAVTSGAAKMRQGFSGLLGGVGALTVGLTAASIAVGAIFQGVSKAHAEAASAMDAMKPKDFDERSITDLQKYAKSLDLAAAQAEKADDAQGGWMGTLEGTAELLSPMENKILDNAIAAGDLGKAAKIAGDAAEAMSEKYLRVGRNIGDGLHGLEDIEKWVTELDLDPTVMTATEMIDAIGAAVSPKAELIGMSLDEALSIDPEIVERNTKAVEDAMSAVSGALKSFSDVLQVTDDPLDPKAAVDAREAVADAEKRLAEARTEAADLTSDATDKQRTEAMNRIADARDDLDDAKTSLKDLLATDSPLDRGKIEEFYTGVIADTEAFSGNIQKALAMGYDPAYVNRLLQAGPEQAGPVLEQLVGATSQSFIDMVNDAEATLTELSKQAVEIARLTQIAVNDQTEGGRQKTQHLDAAIAISQAMTELGEGATIDEIAYASHTGQDIVRQVAQEFNLIADVDTTKATETITQFTTKQREALIGVDVIEADRRHAEIVLATIAQDRTSKVHIVAITDPETQKLIDKLNLGSTLGANSGAYGETGHLHGGIDHYAGGGLRPSMLGSGTNRVWWDEPQTGGEGYFPRLGAGPDRDDNMRTVAGWYGGRYIAEDEMAAKRPRNARPRRRLSRSEPATVVVNALGASAQDVSDAFLFGARQ
jgi:tape measure domain-containing protein